MARRKKDIDWDAVQRDYTENRISLTEIAEKYKLKSHGTILYHAKKEGWRRMEKPPPFELVAEDAIQEVPCGRIPAVRDAADINDPDPTGFTFIGGKENLGVRSEANLNTIITLIFNGWSVHQAYTALGFNAKRWKEWLQLRPEYETLIETARGCTLGRLEQQTFLSAIGGNANAALTYLERQKETKKRWAPPQKENTGTVINVAVGWDRNTAPVIDVTPEVKVIERAE